MLFDIVKFAPGDGVLARSANLACLHRPTFDRQRDLVAGGRSMPGATKADDSPTTADCEASAVLTINTGESAAPIRRAHRQ